MVRTYDEFRRLVQAFADGHHELMTIVGTGGIGKSEIVRRTMQLTHGGIGWTLLKGKHTPLDLYARLYQSRSKPIVLDDLDGLMRDPNNTAMLKCVCDTTPVKRVEWGSFHHAFRSTDNLLPKAFDSISRVCAVANDVGTLNADLSAVQDRGVLLLFLPDALEVHREVARSGWFEDEEVFDFIGQNLFLVSRPSFRLYLTARNHKKSGMDWKSLVLRMLARDTDPKLLLVAHLLADPHHDTLSAPEASRESLFKLQGGGARATYHRYKKELLERRGSFTLREVAAIKLGPVQLDPMYVALCDRRKQLEEISQADDWDSLAQAEPTTVDASDVAEEPAVESEDQLTRLQRLMQRAIKVEDYEKAASLRDEIRRLEAGGE